MVANESTKRNILSLLVDNKPGVLSRVAGFFSGRGFNIDSLCVSETTDPLVSRITLVAMGDMAILEQIKKQLNKLINVIKVMDFTDTEFVQRETALIKVRAKVNQRAEILRMVDIFRACANIGVPDQVFCCRANAHDLYPARRKPRL